jgi:internalin A
MSVSPIPDGNAITPVSLSIWDFGGQDIYHGTHALFTDPRAIYVLVWTPDLESVSDYVEYGLAMKHRPLQYWLDYVESLAGKDAPIIVAQSKCDSELAVVEAPVTSQRKFTWMRRTNCSAKEEWGMDALLIQIKGAVRYSREQFGNVRLPESWTRLENALSALVNEHGRKQISRFEFDALVSALHVSAPAELLLDYLHTAGVLFYRTGLFDDNVVLDQTWALNAIYWIFDREKILPGLLKQHGRFSDELLSRTVWRDFSPTECQLILSMMLKCRICFVVEDGEYIAPDLLPDISTAKFAIEASWRRIPVECAVELHYEFLHEATLREILCRLGSLAGNNALYWRFGCVFYDSRFASQAQISSAYSSEDTGNFPKAGVVVIKTALNRCDELATLLTDSILAISGGAAPEVIWTLRKKDSTAIIDMPSVFASVTPGRLPVGQEEPTTMYLSYHRNEIGLTFAKLLDERLAGAGLQLITDSQTIGYGGSISAFQHAMTIGSRIIVALSDGYLRSFHCVRELNRLFGRHAENKMEFFRHVRLLHLELVDIKTAQGKSSYIQYWNERRSTLDRIAGNDLASSDAALELFRFCGSLPVLLEWFSDVLTPSADNMMSGGTERFVEYLQHGRVL